MILLAALERSAMILRTATLDDLALVRRWDDAPHLADAGGDPEWNDWDWANQLGRIVPWREFLIAEHEGRAIGFVQIIDPAAEETHYWGDCARGLRAIDIWIGEEDCLGQGFGSEMMRLALARCFADDRVAAVLVDPMADNVRAHRFYERLGFAFVERRRFGPDDCCVYRLELRDWRQGS